MFFSINGVTKIALETK